jgi:hypothetical protein
MSKNILFISETLFKERTGASNAIDGKQIFPMIKVAGDIHIQPALGSTLYNRLLAGIEADNLSNDEKYLIDYYITDCIVWYTMSMLPITMGYQLFSKGFLQKTSEESQTPSRSDLELIEQKYQSMAEFYKSRLIAYLQENHTKFSQYLNSTMAIDTIFPEQKAYTCPIFIGDYQRRPNYINSTSTSPDLTVVYYTATGGETQFSVNDIAGRTVIMAARSGLNKVITLSSTTDTGFIQINSNQVTLPIGDVAEAGELFTFLYR